MKHALLVKMSSLGDVVHALPAVTDAAKHGWTFDWVVEEGFADIAALHPAVRRVIPFALRRWRRGPWSNRGEMVEFRAALRAQRYAIALDSQGLIKSAVVTRLARADVRRGYDSASAREPLAARAYADGFRVARAQHAIDRQRQLFAQALGYPLPEDLDYGLGAPKGGAGQSTCLFLHGTTWASKHYPESLWTQLISRAAADGYQVALTWGNEAERVRAEALARNPGVDVWPRMPVNALIERIRATELVVGVDSGLTHLAASLGVPTIGLYGSTNAELTGCRGPSARALSVAFECAPCLSRACTYTGENDGLIQPACYGTLSPETVWQHAMERVRAHRLLHI